MAGLSSIEKESGENRFREMSVESWKEITKERMVHSPRKGKGGEEPRPSSRSGWLSASLQSGKSSSREKS